MSGSAKRGVLTIEPRGGLCNRMRSIDGAVALAADTGLSLRIAWRVDQSLGSPMEALFRPLPVAAEIVTQAGWRPGQYDLVWLRRRLPIPGRGAVLLPADVERMLAAGTDFRSLADRHRPYIRTGKRVHRSFGPKRLFALAPPLAAEVERLAPELGQRIGLHIRHGDHAPGRRFSPTEHFVRRIEALIAADRKTQFFLATDDPEAEMVLLDAFPGRIIVLEKGSRDRGDQRAIEEAAIDLYCLARTKRILGTEASSFSRMAAELGGQPLDLVTSRAGEALAW